jgi:hypothetical protein
MLQIFLIWMAMGEGREKKNQKLGVAVAPSSEVGRLIFL